MEYVYGFYTLYAALCVAILHTNNISSFLYSTIFIHFDVLLCVVFVFNKCFCFILNEIKGKREKDHEKDETPPPCARCLAIVRVFVFYLLL